MYRFASRTLVRRRTRPIRRLIRPLDSLTHSLLRSLPHPRSVKIRLRRLLYLFVGIAVMGFAGMMATSHHCWAPGCPAWLWDATAYFIHGLGAIPVIAILPFVD